MPEVEIFSRYFAEHALGQRIAEVRVLDEAAFLAELNSAEGHA